jgi:hypothetical protein
MLPDTIPSGTGEVQVSKPPILSLPTIAGFDTVEALRALDLLNQRTY